MMLRDECVRWMCSPLTAARMRRGFLAVLMFFRGCVLSDHVQILAVFALVGLFLWLCSFWLSVCQFTSSTLIFDYQNPPNRHLHSLGPLTRVKSRRQGPNETQNIAVQPVSERLDDSPPKKQNVHGQSARQATYSKVFL